ncbi:hypothetical protein J0683_25250, partial [Vibrio parahaemolyticus]|uniref:hypothetical protein n=1 Tax=Vibrio parahaemolyticus TaxID=670 RepID=UPI001A909451|nr:hypothetical protein [Vibrio parahaemolyticus]
MITYLVPLPQLGYYERTLILLAFVLITLPFVALFGFIIARRKKKREQAAAAADSAEQATAQPARKAAPAGSYP